MRLGFQFFSTDARADRARPGIEAIVNEVDVAFVWKTGLVAELDEGRDLRRARAHAFALVAQLYVF